MRFKCEVRKVGAEFEETLSKESGWGDSEDSLRKPLPTHRGWRDGPVRSSKWHSLSPFFFPLVVGCGLFSKEICVLSQTSYAVSMKEGGKDSRETPSMMRSSR